MRISDFLVDKDKKLLYLKKHKSFKKVFDNFLQILEKRSLGFMFSGYGWVKANIHIFFVLYVTPIGAAYAKKNSKRVYQTLVFVLNLHVVQAPISFTIRWYQCW